MQDIKCGVNSSLHNSGCCIRSVAPWINVLTQHTVFTKRLIYYKFTFVRYSAEQGTTHRPTSCLEHCVPFLWPREEHAAQIGWWFHCGQCLWWGLLLLLTLFLLQIVFPIASLSTWFPSQCQQPALHCWLPLQVLFIFFRPLVNTHNRLPCLDYYVWHGTVAET
jgi:hypothetical protein